MPDTHALPASALRVRRRRLWAAAAMGLALLAAAGALAWRGLHRPPPITLAFAHSLSGAAALLGEDAQTATQLYLDEVNAAGGVDGHPVRLQVFDDRSDPAASASNVPAVLQSPVVAVLGHSLSATSVTAGPGYRAGRIAALTGNASSDEITQDNPYYFRAQSPNGVQGDFLAQYIRTVLLRHGTLFMRPPDVDLVSSNATYGRTFRAGFIRSSGSTPPKVFLVQPGEHLADSALATAEALAQEPEPRIIVLGVAPDVIAPTLQAIRRRGIRSMVVLAAGAADDNFTSQFAAEPEERDTPGFFTDNVFAIAPMILDNTGGLGQALVAQFKQATGHRAGWIAAAAQDAARMMVEALRRAHVGGTADTLAADREAVRGALASINSLKVAVPGINGPLYFDARQNMPRIMHFGLFRNGRFVSAPLQLAPVQDPDLLDIDHEVAQGHIVEVGGVLYWLQRVVYTGIDITRLSDVNVRDGTFSAEFYLWMRYGGTDDLPTQVAFSGFTGAFDPARPLQSGREDGLNYRLYRVSGTFKADYDLHDYPFDRQSLLIRLQNRDHPREEVAYVIDTFGLQLDRPKLGPPGGDAYRALQLWDLAAVRPFVDSSAVRSTLGKPALFDTAQRSEHAAFDMEVVLQRKAAAFMVKTLIPLFLLALVVFATLFFPPSLASVRATIPVTAILTTAVLLLSVNNQLPALGYTVALEYIFYVFFALCLMAMLTGLVSQVLHVRKALAASKAIDRGGQSSSPRQPP